MGEPLLSTKNDLPEAKRWYEKAAKTRNKMAADFLKDLLGRMAAPGQARVCMLKVGCPPEATEQDRAKKRQEAKALRERFGKGTGLDAADFEMQAALTGMYNKGQLLDALDKPAFEQPVGEVGPVIETEGGFFILLVTDRNPR